MLTVDLFFKNLCEVPLLPALSPIANLPKGDKAICMHNMMSVTAAAFSAGVVAARDLSLPM